MKKIFAIVLVLGVLAVTLGLAQAQKPSDLKYPPLKYDPPDPKAFRVQLANGLRAYIQEDHSLPLVNVSALVNFGGLYVAKDRKGLDAVLADTLIKGGTKTREGSAIEDRINFLGGSLNFMVGDRTSTLNLTVLSRDLDEGLTLLFDVLINAEFREAALNLAKARLIEQLRQANDQPSEVLSREYARVIYGDSPQTWDPNKKTYDNVTRLDLQAVKAKYLVPGNIILAASGDFNKAQFKAKVNKLLAGWGNRAVAIPAFSRQFPAPEPGVYFIQMPISQGYINIGHLGLEDTNPDYFAVQVMNYILGGGSFSSRITSKVRSTEGLSYNQGSRFEYRWGYPGLFAGYVQTKSSTVGYAISLILAELNRIRREPVSNAEMETALNFFLESFSNFFESPQMTMANFANLEMTGKPLDYYKTYRDKIRAVTKAKIQEVANRYIQPDKAVIMIVGDFEPCNKGGDKWPGPLDTLGKLHRLSLKDPMTGEARK